MNDKKLLTQTVPIKTEHVSSTLGKGVLASSLISPNAIKRELPSRLPSFKPPRDLLLTGSTTSHTTPALKDFINVGNKANKRKYTPNVNAFRKKCSSNAQPNVSSTGTDLKVKQQADQSKKSPAVHKKRNSNFIQTKGVFSEGVAPGKVKAFHSSYSEKSYNESNVLEKPKLVLNKKINKADEDAKLQTILGDNFVDDPKNLPDLNFMPSRLPTVYNAKHKFFNPNDIEKTFQNLQVKVEKIGVNQWDDVKDDKSEVFDAFEENKSPKLLLFEFPKIFQALDDVDDKKKSSKGQANETENKAKLSNLSSAGEGHWGYLRIHESGNAYFQVGSTIIPISIGRHITRQDVMSTNIDQTHCRGEVINLGTVEASFTCSTNFDDIH